MKQLLVALLCAGLVTAPLPAAHAATSAKPGLSTGTIATPIDYRGRRHHGRHHGGPGAAGVIGAIIAGTLIAAAIREGRAEEDDLERCAEDFYGFDPETGTYINRYGEERVCPYLR